jgi:hypothetical protein
VTKIKAGNRCSDCTHVKRWKTSKDKATCQLYHEEGFHPDRSVPVKCIGKVESQQ